MNILCKIRILFVKFASVFCVFIFHIMYTEKKRFALSLLFMAAAFVLFYSCKKESSSSGKLNPEIQNTLSAQMATHLGVVKENDYLYFADLNTFQTVCSQLDTLNDASQTLWESYYSGYVSMRKHYDAMELALQDQDVFLSPCDDEALGTVINRQGIVRVDTVAFLLDFANHKVYEVYPVTPANINVLKQKAEVNNDTMYVMQYSMDDEIFYPAGWQQQGPLKTSDGQLCSDKKRGFRWLKKLFGACPYDQRADPSPDDDESNFTDVNNSTIGYKYIYRLKYQRAGLRFSIVYKVKHFKQIGENGPWRRYPGIVCFEAIAKMKVFCGPERYENTFCQEGPLSPSQPYGNYNSTNPTYKNILYKSGNRLSRIKVTGYFFMENVSDVPAYATPSRQMSIIDNPYSTW